MKEMDLEKLYDVIVIGGGPAGLTAALYLARARYRVLVVEKEHFGGQITNTSEVVNYPGVEKTTGVALTDIMRKQAQSFGAEFLLAAVDQLDMTAAIKTVFTSRGRFFCFGVLLATGAHPRMVGFEGEREFRGHGVAYCATCDGEFFTGKDIFVIGGGFAAAEESVFLTKYARHVTVLIREDDFTCAKATADVAKAHEKITILTNVEVELVSGDSSLRLLKYRNRKTGEVTEYVPPEGETFGVFVFAGYEPATDLVQGLVELNEQGYVMTDQNQKTNIDGLYAAGDVCMKNLRQVVTAVGDGAIAATELEKYAAAMQRKTGLQPTAPIMRVPLLPSEQNEAVNVTEEILTEDMKTQLDAVFSKMDQPLLLKLYLDERPISKELEQYARALSALTDKLSCEIDAPTLGENRLPFVAICRENGETTGLAFHGVPGGHEFTSFVLGLYNASGPGQTIDADVKEEILAINRPIDMKILVSISCTMCPELVTSAQRIAAINPLVRAEVYDLNHFPDLKEHYQVMSVPCLVVNDTKVSFGKKNLVQLLEFLRDIEE
ncbi:MAG TPA: FAD-dependent oxidoreductase [Firmicutes bacterium]|nr:FAD-dependent oxidoreductase [Bacillota bacterium]